MERQLVCDECRAKQPALLSCIHTFPPRVRKSTISDRNLAEEAREVQSITDPRGSE